MSSMGYIINVNHFKMPRLNDNQKMRAVALLENGWSLQRIADDLQVCKTSIYKLKRKWNETHTVTYNHAGGRPKVSNQEIDETLIENLRNNPFKSAVNAIEDTNFPGSRWTAYRRIKNSDLRNFCAARKCALTENHKINRLHFANTYINEGDMWENVIFSDEKVFQSTHNGSVRVYRPPNSRYIHQYVKPTHNSGRFSVTFWAWISMQGPGECLRLGQRLTSVVYRDILQDVMLPSVTQAHGNNYIFQQVHYSYLLTHIQFYIYIFIFRIIHQSILLISLEIGFAITILMSCPGLQEVQT